MDVPVPTKKVLSALVKLRRELQDELGGLVEKRSGLEGELEALGKEGDRDQAMRAGAGGGRREAIGGPRAGAAKGRRGWIGPELTGKRLDQAVGNQKSAFVTHWGLYVCCDSPRKRLPSGGPVPRSVPCPLSRSLSLSPSRPSPWRCGMATCCR
jgi:hypothetical protein